MPTPKQIMMMANLVIILGMWQTLLIAPVDAFVSPFEVAGKHNGLARMIRPPSSNLYATPPTFGVGILNRFRKKRKVEQVATITPGEAVKDVDVEQIVVLDDGTVQNNTLSIREVMGNGKSILLGMPGAFTPTCSKEHLPGYVSNADKFAALGYDNIVVATTNDKFVNQEWMSSQGLLQDDSKKKNNKKITMVCDGDGELVKSLGLAEDMGFGIGIRSKRFALLAQNGVVTELLTDEGLDSCDATSAERVLEMITPVVEQTESEEMNPVVLGGIAAVVALGVVLQALTGGGPSPPPTSNAPPPPAVIKTQPIKSAPSPVSEESFSMLRNYLQ